MPRSEGMAVRIERYEFPDELLYDRLHNWVRLKDGMAVQGLTAYAWQTIGTIGSIDLPAPGRSVGRSEELTALAGTGETLRLRAAISGEIVAVNQRLQQKPALAGQEPYGSSWLLQIRPSQPQELEQLRRPDDPFFMEWFLLARSAELARQLGGPEHAILSLHHDLEQTHNRLEILYEIARAATSTLDLDQVLQIVARRTVDIFDAQGCSIRLLKEGGLTLNLAAAWGLSPACLERDPIDIRHSPIDRQALCGEAFSVPDIRQDVRFPNAEALAKEGICAVLCCPLMVRGRASGVIWVYGAAGACYGEEDAEFLHTIANQVAVAIANAMAYRELAEIDRAKSQFVLTVTHELRAPVATVQSLLRVISGGYAGEVLPKQRELIERAERRTLFLQQLIDDLLELAEGKTEQLAQAPHPVLLNPLVQKVVNQLRPVAEEKEQDLRVYVPHTSLYVQATEEGIGRIVTNLVGNAIKYTPPRGSVEITLDPQNAEARLVVRDTGIGIPPEALPHLFEEFFRANNAKQIEREGTGLGLSIVKSLVDRYGGRIAVESQLGGGSTFTLLLPLLDSRDDLDGIRQQDAVP